MDRRPILVRSSRWAGALASFCVRVGIGPNAVSVMSVVFAVMGVGALHLGGLGEAGSLLVLAACVELRLLANMLDGLIAVEGGKQSATGELFNEIPDRVADVIFLAGAGYGCHHGEWGVAVGWGAAVLAVGTAYVRALGARRGAPQDFCGPQAKPHRMHLLAVGCVAAAVEGWMGRAPWVLFCVLILINVGTAVTCVLRVKHLADVVKRT